METDFTALVSGIVSKELSQTALSVSRMTTGLCNEVYSVELPFRSVIVRMNTYDRFLRGSEHNIPLFRSLGIEVPEILDTMQRNPQQLEMSHLVSYAEQIGLNVAAFQSCVESGKYKDRVQQRAAQAQVMGARGTPAFVIGKSTPTGVDGTLFVGAQDFSFFEAMLKRLK